MRAIHMTSDSGSYYVFGSSYKKDIGSSKTTMNWYPSISPKLRINKLNRAHNLNLWQFLTNITKWNLYFWVVEHQNSSTVQVEILWPIVWTLGMVPVVKISCLYLEIVSTFEWLEMFEWHGRYTKCTQSAFCWCFWFLLHWV